MTASPLAPGDLVAPALVAPDDRDRAADRPPAWSPGHAHWFTIVVFVGLHIGFGTVADFGPPPITTLHAFIVLAMGIWLVGVRRNAEAVACIVGYIAACDVFWRMTGAQVPWEISKLAMIALLFVAIVRVIRRPRGFGLPLMVLFLLLPSAMVTVERFGLLGGGRERLSFELAAHVGLVLAVIFFSNLRAERQTLAGVLWVVVGPMLTVNTIATLGTASLGSGDFSGGLSNTAASGGYGPNQVSALVGAGALLCIFLVFFDRRPVLRVLAGGLAIWLLAQSALTFSRGGSFNLVVALIVALPFFLRSAQMAVRFLTVAAAVSAVIWFGMIPILQSMTGDEFGQRFTNSDPTLRTDLMATELDTWGDNVALGIGVGMMERTESDRGAANRGELPQLPAHTEYTRLLAEHGLLGLAVIVVLFLLAVRAVRAQRVPTARIFSVVLLAWCASEVAHSATRLAIVAYLFGLAALPVVADGTLAAEEAERAAAGTADPSAGLTPEPPTPRPAG